MDTRLHSIHKQAYHMKSSIAFITTDGFGATRANKILKAYFCEGRDNVHLCRILRSCTCLRARQI